MLGELALGDLDLAAPADAASAADRIEIGAELSRRVEERRAVGEVPALAGGGEDDEAVRHGGAGMMGRGTTNCHPRESGDPVTTDVSIEETRA